MRALIMPQLLMLLACVFALTSISYARPAERDRAARVFQAHMDNLQQNVNDDFQDNDNSGQNDQNDNDNFAQDQGNQQDSNNNNEFNDENAQGGEYNDDGNNDQSGDVDHHTLLENSHAPLEKEVSELKQDMASIVLRLDRLERKLKIHEENSTLHNKKVTHHKQKQHKKKKVTKAATTKAKHKK